MPLIQLNPKLWTLSSVRIDDDNTLSHGDELEVSVEDWEELRKRRSRQMGNRYQTLVSAESVEAPPERLYVQASALLELSSEELKVAAAERGLSTSGNKTALAERIVEFETTPDDGADEPATG